MTSRSLNVSPFQLSQTICRIQYLATLLSNPRIYEFGCNSHDDGTLCWKESPNDTLIWTVCEPVKGLLANRECFPNHTWGTPDYSQCHAPNVSQEIMNGTVAIASITFPSTEFDPFKKHHWVMFYIYIVGYSMSLLLLLIALGCFFIIRPLDLRLKIHTNLTLSLVLYQTLWLLYSAVLHRFYTTSGLFCTAVMMLLKFLTMSTFSWTAVEGIYLHLKILDTLHSARLRPWMCFAIGWGFPIVVLLAALATKWLFGDELCYSQLQDKLDYIFVMPMVTILAANLIILCRVMSKITYKIRQEEQATMALYVKSLRALFILCPLLGTSYLLGLLRLQNPAWLYLVVAYYVCVVSATQGMLVAVLFCFQSTEVWSHFAPLRTRLINSVRRGPLLKRRLLRDPSCDTVISYSTSTNRINSDKEKGTGGRYKNVMVMDENGKLRCLSSD